MLRLKVKEVAERRGIEDAATLSRRADIATDTAYRLWRGEIGDERGRGVGLRTLHKVAQALGVKIADLYDEDVQALRPAAA